MHKNSTTLSVRMDEELLSKLEAIAREAGLTKSEIARIILSESSGIIIYPASQIAAELFRICQLLERHDLDETTRQEIWKCCHLLKLEIKRVFEEGGKARGNFEGD